MNKKLLSISFVLAIIIIASIAFASVPAVKQVLSSNGDLLTQTNAGENISTVNATLKSVEIATASITALQFKVATASATGTDTTANIKIPVKTTSGTTIYLLGRE